MRATERREPRHPGPRVREDNRALAALLWSFLWSVRSRLPSATGPWDRAPGPWDARSRGEGA
eukprot:5813995-Pyramimonas_sp.AAC.1